MACPNKNKDAQLMRSISERNMKKEKIIPYEIMEIVWEGSIIDIQLYVEDLENVLYITKLSSGNYVASVAVDLPK